MLRLAGGVSSSDVADYDLLKEEALPAYRINMTRGGSQHLAAT